MITEAILDYVNRIAQFQIPDTTVRQVKDMFEAIPALSDQLSDPSIDIARKNQVIDKVFPLEMRDFLKLLCDNGDIDQIGSIFEAYEQAGKQEDEFTAELHCINPPSESQFERIRAYLCRKYNRDDIDLKVKEDPSVLGGFRILVGDDIIDWSVKGRTDQLKEKLS